MYDDLGTIYYVAPTWMVSHHHKPFELLLVLTNINVKEFLSELCFSNSLIAILSLITVSRLAVIVCYLMKISKTHSRL